MSGSEATVRMLTLLPWLRSRGAVDVAEVAEQFGVSQPQLLRELATLTFVGPGQGGGELVDISYEGGTIVVHDSQGLEFPLRLSAAEAVSLIAGLGLLTQLPGPRTALEAAVSALAKLETAAGAAASEAGGTLVVDHVPADAEVEHAVATSVKMETRLKLTYAGGGGDELTEREVDPIRLIVVSGRSYLEGWCLRSEAVRLFRLDRIVSAETTLIPAAIPTDVPQRDPDTAVLPEGRDVRVHLGPAAVWVTEERSCVAVEALPDGSFDATLRVADPRWLVRLMLSLGDEAHLIEADDLTQTVSDRAQAALDRYADLTPPS